jgi:predicted Zn-dependent protease with MMP-like domain
VTQGPIDADTAGAGDFSFEEAVEEALAAVPHELRKTMSNVTVVVEDEPPGGAPLLGLYQGVPLTRRGSQYGGVLPDKITIYRNPLLRLYGGDANVLRAQIRRVVLHEIAHHFGISDQRLVDMGRY